MSTQFYNHGTCTAAAIANAGCAYFAMILLQYIYKGNDDACTTAAEGMPQ